jgi:hypothetical protein
VTTFRASVRVDDGTLHTSRPLTAPEKVADLIDSVIYNIASGDGGDVQSVDVTVETSGESDTPIGDSISGTSSTPLAATIEDDDEPTTGALA